MVLIMGVAGAGKSMQGKILAKKLGYRWLSTGELLRESVSGVKKQEMLAGKLLADSELIEIIDKALSASDPSHMILDGFPRTLAQARWLLGKHDKGSINLDIVIVLNVSKQTVMKRLLDRGRQDDNEQSISKRFEEHEKMTLPIIGLYKSRNINVKTIDGDQSIEAVSRSISDLFDKGSRNHADKNQD